MYISHNSTPRPYARELYVKLLPSPNSSIHSHLLPPIPFFIFIFNLKTNKFQFKPILHICMYAYAMFMCIYVHMYVLCLHKKSLLIFEYSFSKINPHWTEHQNSKEINNKCEKEKYMKII